MTPEQDFDPAGLIIPRPLSIERKPGTFIPTGQQTLTVAGYESKHDPLIEAVQAGTDGFNVKKKTSKRPRLTIGAAGQERWPDQALDELTGGVGRDLAGQAYVISVTAEGVKAAAGGSEGLFRAAVTLGKLTRADGSIPCVSLQDMPALPSRAVLLDVSRGKVPTLDYLKHLVDLIALINFNQLTFNIEHVFEPGAGEDGITAGQMKELDRHARERHVEIIPFQQSLGHLRHLLSRPEHRELAYDPELLWSIDPSSEGTYTLLSDLYNAQIKALGSGLFHVGCDEPFDMIKGFDPSRFNGRELPQVILGHLEKLHTLLAARGKTMMAWADAVVSHPEVLAGVPDDLVLCHWQYGSGLLEGPDHYRGALEAIASRGLRFYACSTTWSMTRIFPDLEVARANHASLMPEAKRLGAMGSMVTIWGDMGHMNLTGLETYPLALAARHAWEPDPLPEIDFDRAYAWTVFRDPSVNSADLAGHLDRINRILRGPAGMGGVGFLFMFDEPLSARFLDRSTGDLLRAAREIRSAVQSSRECLAGMEAADVRFRQFWLDSHLAALQSELLAQKLEVIALLGSIGTMEAGTVLEDCANRCDRIAGLAAGMLSLLESRWLAGSLESDLEVNRKRYRALIRAWQGRSDELRGLARAGGEAPSLEKLRQASPTGYAFDPLREIGLTGLL